MKNLIARLNLTTNRNSVPNHAREISTSIDEGEQYDNFLNYCKENEISTQKCEADEIEACAELISVYAKGSRYDFDKIYFWID